MWLRAKCGTDRTFRDAYSSRTSKSTAHSASFHRIGTSSNVSRQLCNESSTLFMKLLKFPRDEHLFALFSCSVSETNNSARVKTLNGVVTDGTALGILGTLTKFSRHTKIAKPVSGVPDKQYLMREPKLRGFVDAALLSAKSVGEKQNFTVHLKQSLRRNQTTLVSRLLSIGDVKLDEANTARRFLTSFLRIQQSEL